MMQRLDNALREGRRTGDLAKRVDDSLKQETVAFFAKVANSNARKWNQALQRATSDTESILHEAQDKGLYSPADGNTNRKQKYTASDLEMEDLRLEEEYNRNWLQHEGFHLQEAFRSQRNKLDREWATYTEQIYEVTNAKKRSLLGNNYGAYVEKQNHPSPANGNSNDERFHHPEKQKSLIHTAPVITPKLDHGKSKAAAGSAMRAVRHGKEDSAIQAEVIY